LIISGLQRTDTYAQGKSHKKKGPGSAMGHGILKVNSQISNNIDKQRFLGMQQGRWAVWKLE